MTSSTNGTGPAASRRITLCVMKGQDGDIMAESVQELQPSVTITDKGPYLQLQSEHEIILDIEDIASRRGTPMTVQDVLVSFSSFVGRVEVTDEEIRITPDLPQLDDQ